MFAPHPMLWVPPLHTVGDVKDYTFLASISFPLICKEVYNNPCPYVRNDQTYLFVCLGVFFRPTREFFTHMETSPLPVKGCKC